MRLKLAHIALVLSIIALVVSLFTAAQFSRNSDAALIDALMEQNEQLQAQLDALTQPGTVLPEGETPPPAFDAVLSARPWADSKGADVTLNMETTGEPTLLRIMLDDKVVAEVGCQPEGDRLTATVRLIAANGYSYSVVIGSEARTLASPENLSYPELVYLADALTSYCNLVVDDWYVRNNFLVLETCFAQVQTPQLGDTGALTCEGARLVLKNMGNVIAEYPVTLVPGDGAGSYEAAVVHATFKLPYLPEGQQVDLLMEATLSDGQLITADAATWHVMPHGFSMAAG